MKVITPLTIADAMLTASAPEPAAGETAWVSAGSYSLGDQRIRVATHRIYECIQTHSGRTALPEVDTDYWLDIAPTNAWAAFDNVIGTSCTLASPLTISIESGENITGIGFVGLVGTEIDIEVDSTADGIVYSRTVDLDDSVVLDYWDYFFEPYVQRDKLVLTDLPPYDDATITVTLTGTGNVSIGVLQIGTADDIGMALHPSSASFTDYSRKIRDDFGNTTIVERSYSDSPSFKLRISKQEFPRVRRKIIGLRATPCIWIGSEESDLRDLVPFGFVRSFSPIYETSEAWMCDLEIEGMT